jgi:hypothetical protein
MNDGDSSITWRESAYDESAWEERGFNESADHKTKD